MEEGDLYTDLARYYDLIYAWKDYEKDVERLEELLGANKTSSGNRLLDVGCGTGNHLTLLRDRYDCVGIDTSDEMLEVAREKLPGTKLLNADMMEFDLGERFDVVICMFSTLGYATTLGELGKVAANIERHLVDGGVAVVEPWLRKDDIRPGFIGMHTYDSPKIKIARQGRLIIEEDISVFEAHYLIAEEGEIRHVIDRHELALFGEDVIVEALEGAGLRAWFEEDGFAQDRGAIIAVKE